MEDLRVVENWKDKILGDLKEFSSKKHKPVGMHHLIQEINKLANPDKLLEISFAKFDKSFLKKTFFEKIEYENIKIVNKLPIKRISEKLKSSNEFHDKAKSVIVYAIPVPKSVFKYPLEDIYKYFENLKSEKDKIDEKILHALAKYGYWGIPEKLNGKFLFELKKNKIFKSSNLGEIAPNGFPVTSKYGPRVFVSYMITDAPLKVQLDKPVNICNEECKNTISNPSFEYMKYYKNTFGITKTVIDSAKSIIKNNRFGEYIDFCYKCKLGTEYEINLLVKDPLDYKS